MIEHSNVPNFDAMTSDELWEFWKLTGMSGGVPWNVARNIFPSRPKGYVSTVAQFKHYAANKAVAVKARAEGRIDVALTYERIADSIYDRLPTYAKW